MRPALLDTIVWSVSLGASFLQNSSRVDSPSGRLVAARQCPAHDIVAFVPRAAAFDAVRSPIAYAADAQLLRARLRSPEQQQREAEDELPWFPGVSTSQFEHAALMAAITWVYRNQHRLQQFRPSIPGGEAAHLSLVADAFQRAFRGAGEQREGDEPTWALRDSVIDAVSSVDFDAAVDTALHPRLIAHALPPSPSPSDISADRAAFRREFVQCFLALELRAIGPTKALVPLLDMCPHRAEPNCRVGTVTEEDAEVMQFLVEQKGMTVPASAVDGFLLQTTRSLEPDEVLTLDRATLLDLEDDVEFQRWFGFPYR